ncbi:FecR family protein [Pleomorphovibrio marinus]|uniref:FecR family protein n=1 Tax=Pleomorphovibrio marinus TaxID=2164132 RepID=UPI000E0C4CA8|nr:FecR domain-containing protein [Pleomorphovibrio marinus]
MDKNSLYKRFLKNELSEKELFIFSQWLQTKEAEEFLNEKMDFPENLEHQEAFSWNGQNLKDKILGEIQASKYSEERKNRQLWTTRIGIAASISLIIGFVFLMETNPEEPQEITPTIITKSNEPGKKTKLQLKDGSTVYLNADSEISYQEEFLSDRKVVLKGEAYFEVAKHPESPFRVFCEDLETKALGTSFNIRSFEPGVIDIVLASGSISVTGSGGEELELQPGEGVRKTSSIAPLSRYKADVEKALLWKSGILHLDKLGIEETFKRLERWYGIEIIVTGNTPKNGKFSGTFTNSETLPNVLKVLQYSTDFDFSIDGKKVNISF